MTQRDSLLELFRQNGNVLTLSQILQTPMAAEYRKLICQLRDAGHTILVEQNRKNPGMNVYRLVKAEPVHFVGDQAVMFEEAV